MAPATGARDGTTGNLGFEIAQEIGHGGLEARGLGQLGGELGAGDDEG
jgi:hypothetical protein